MTGSAKQFIAPLAETMDCVVANAPLRKRFAFVAGNDDVGDHAGTGAGSAFATGIGLNVIAVRKAPSPMIQEPI